MAFGAGACADRDSDPESASTTEHGSTTEDGSSTDDGVEVFTSPECGLVPTDEWTHCVEGDGTPECTCLCAL